MKKRMQEVKAYLMLSEVRTTGKVRNEEAGVKWKDGYGKLWEGGGDIKFS